MRDVCADCGCNEPTWASLNRGILLCQDCCSVHRSMGRHISWVRSLQQGWWSPSLLKMVEALSKAGANSIWEHSLMDRTISPTSCKPSSNDPVRANKEEFIRSKHEELTYILRGEQEGPEGIGAQLHAAARTNDLLTSLRLFSQGADPNFYHEEKGSCPLHVAAKVNQGLQAELLMIHGADLIKRDSAGRTPEDVARDSGHVALAERLRTARFHVFDRLIQYLCSRYSGVSQPGLLDALSQEASDNIEGRSKLEALSNCQFEKLVADVYDEIDRREAGQAWQSEGIGSDPAPFLPPHPDLSATRNQGRQKLGRLSAHGLDQLLRDVIREARRRDALFLNGKGNNALLNGVSGLKLRPDISDDEPLYDIVASDDDYGSTNSGEPLLPISQSQPTAISAIKSHPSAITSVQPQPSTINSINQTSQSEDFLRNSLLSSEATIVRLQSDIQLLQEQISSLIKENCELREEVTRSKSYPRSVELLRDSDEQLSVDRSRSLRPISMYEARDRPRNWNSIRNSTSPLHSPASWPEYNDVITRTELVTQRIKELCAGMKMLDYDLLPPAAARIRSAVGDLTSIFCQTPPDETVRELTSSARQLEMECACAASLPITQETTLPKIRTLAYNIAKATKQLVVKTQAHQT